MPQVHGIMKLDCSHIAHNILSNLSLWWTCKLIVKSCIRRYVPRGTVPKPALGHIMLFSTVLGSGDSLRIAAAAFAALAACLQAGSTQESRMLLQLTPRIGTALRRPGLMVAADAARPDSAAAVASLYGLMMLEDDQMLSVVANRSVGPLVPAASRAARWAASSAAKALDGDMRLTGAAVLLQYAASGDAARASAAETVSVAADLAIQQAGRLLHRGVGSGKGGAVGRGGGKADSSSGSRSSATGADAPRSGSGGSGSGAADGTPLLQCLTSAIGRRGRRVLAQLHAGDRG